MKYHYFLCTVKNIDHIVHKCCTTLFAPVLNNMQQPDDFYICMENNFLLYYMSIMANLAKF